MLQTHTSQTANAVRVVKARLRKDYPELDVDTAGVLVANATKLFSLATLFTLFTEVFVLATKSEN